MLVPILQHVALTLGPGVTRTLVLEADIPNDYVLDPVVSFWNTGPVAVDMGYSFVLDFGTGSDPLESGTFTTVVRTAASVASGDVVPCSLYTRHLIKDVSRYPFTSHTFTVTNNDAVQDATVRWLVSGMFDEQLAFNINRFVTSRV